MIEREHASVHKFFLISRSGKNSVEFYSVDIDENEKPLDELLWGIARIAHDPDKQSEKYEHLLDVLKDCFDTIEKIPGNNAEAISTMNDGRRLMIKRGLE
jgi:hypothetical protein